MFTSKEYIPGKPTHKVVPFIRINGRMVRDNRAREVSINSNAVKGDSLSKFPRAVGKIGYHKWS